MRTPVWRCKLVLDILDLKKENIFDPVKTFFRIASDSGLNNKEIWIMDKYGTEIMYQEPYLQSNLRKRFEKDFRSLQSCVQKAHKLKSRWHLIFVSLALYKEKSFVLKQPIMHYVFMF